MNRGLATSRRFVLVLGLLTGLVAFAIDISLPAIPAMVRSLATDLSSGQQIVGLFMAGMAVGQLPAGLASDRLGRLPVLYTGMVLFTIAGAMTALCNDIGLMLAARFLQGIGASTGVVLARAIVRDISSGNEAARLLSVMIMVFTAAPMVAPLLGTYLVLAWGWRAPFAVTTLAGLLILYGIWTSLRETHKPAIAGRLGEQFRSSVKEIGSHRQCLYGVVIVMVTVIGIMSLVSGSAAIVVEIYGYPVRYFGAIFALSGLTILLGSILNRRLLLHTGALQVIGIGAAIAGIAGLQLLVMSLMSDPPFWWVWSAACLFMGSTALLVPNATALALDPVPEVAGVAASVIGTVQSACGAGSAILSSHFYNGTILNVTLVLAFSGITLAVLSATSGLMLKKRDPGC